MKNIILFVAIAITMGSCSPKTVESTPPDSVEIKGQIQKLGMTTYQYGTHSIHAEQKTFALKSTKVNLDDYTAKDVTIKGFKVNGYPIENGPELIEVTEITLQKD